MLARLCLQLAELAQTNALVYLIMWSAVVLVHLWLNVRVLSCHQCSTVHSGRQVAAAPSKVDFLSCKPGEMSCLCC